MEKSNFNYWHLAFFILGFITAIFLFTPLRAYSAYLLMFIYLSPLIGEILIAFDPKQREKTALKKAATLHDYPAHRRNYRLFMRNMPLVAALVTLKPVVITFFIVYTVVSFFNTQDIMNRIEILREKARAAAREIAKARAV